MSEIHSFKMHTQAVHSFKGTATCTQPEVTSNPFAEVVQSLQRLQNDTTIPNHVRKSIGETLKAIQTPGEISIRASRARQALEEITDNETVEAYTRTQLLNIVSLLEQV